MLGPSTKQIKTMEEKTFFLLDGMLMTAEEVREYREANNN